MAFIAPALSAGAISNFVNIKDNNGLLANFTSCYHLHITISSNPGRGKKRSVKR